MSQLNLIEIPKNIRSLHLPAPYFSDPIPSSTHFVLNDYMGLIEENINDTWTEVKKKTRSNKNKLPNENGDEQQRFKPKKIIRYVPRFDKFNYQAYWGYLPETTDLGVIEKMEEDAWNSFNEENKRRLRSLNSWMSENNCQPYSYSTCISN